MALTLKALSVFCLLLVCYCVQALQRPSQDTLEADPETLPPESETGFYPSLSARQSSGSTSPDVPIVTFFAISNVTVCGAGLISWTYSGPENLIGKLLVTNSDTAGIELLNPRSPFTQELSSDINFSATPLLYVWSPVRVPTGTYTIFAVFPQTQYISQPFSVGGQTGASCSNSASSSGTNNGFNAKLIAPLVSALGILMLLLSFAIFLWLRRRRLAQTKPTTSTVPYFVRTVPRHSFSTLRGEVRRTSKTLPNSSRRKLIPSATPSMSTGATDGMSISENSVPADRWSINGAPSSIQSKSDGLVRLSMDIPKLPVKRSATQHPFLSIDPYSAAETRAGSDTAYSPERKSSVPSARATDGSSFCTATTLVTPGDEGLGVVMAQIARY